MFIRALPSLGETPKAHIQWVEFADYPIGITLRPIYSVADNYISQNLDILSVREAAMTTETYKQNGPINKGEYTSLRPTWPTLEAPC